MTQPAGTTDSGAAAGEPLRVRSIASAHARSENYLPFVDGLRAISILSVVGFHAGVPGFSGGFIGVDIFFVISGFLICNQIKTSLEGGRFSIFAFYARRGIRILPAYLAMLLVVIAVAPFLLPSPTVYLDFALAAVISPLMFSNVLFYLRQGYFDIAANQKPLLHTWTLSVEEQFYFVVPVLLMLVYRLGGKRFGKTALAIALTLGAASFIGCVMKTSTSGANPAFYLSHFRAWEFVAGALVTGPVIATFARMPRAVAEIVGALGLFAIIATVIVLDARMPFPGWRAAIPVAGAALLILSGLAHRNIVAARLLALRPLTEIGLVSYSWYLWHWPILSFLRIARLGEDSLIPDVIGGGLWALIIAWLSYRYIEQPVRRFRPASGDFQRAYRIVVIAVSSCLLVAAIGGASGFIGYRATEAFANSRYGTEGRGTLTTQCQIESSTTLPGECTKGRYGVLLGDSSAGAMIGSFAKYFDAKGVRLVALTRGGCDPLRFTPAQRKDNRAHGCANLLGPFEQILTSPTQPLFVIINSAWAERRGLTAERISELIGQFDRARTNVLLLGPIPTFETMSLDCVVLSDRFGRGRDACDRPRAAVEKDRAPVVKVLSTAAEKFPNARYADPIDLFCNAQTCRPYRGNKIYYRDGGHVVPQGADFIADSLSGEFARLVSR